MKIDFSDTAKAQYISTLDYLDDINPAIADNFYLQVKEMTDRLSAFPLHGSYIPEFPNSAYKQVFVKPYRFFYRVDDRAESIIITAVYHDKQIPLKPE